MINFKESYLREEFDQLKRKLKNIAEVMEKFVEYKYKGKLVVTSVYREDQTSTHMYFRGVDLRPEGMSHEECKYVEHMINMLMPYDKKWYQSVMYHDTGSGWHFHVQVKA